MKRRVVPAAGATRPSVAAHVSRVRTLVVPTATTLPPRRLAASTAAEVSSPREYSSGWISCSSTSPVRIGEKVPYPIDRVSLAVETPARPSWSTISGSKCRPAVGAATEPGLAAYTVWYRTASSEMDGSPGARRMYGGRGISPSRSSASWTGPPASSRTDHRPSPRRRRSVARSSSPTRKDIPSLNRFDGLASASQVSPPASPRAIGDRRKISTAAPVSFRTRRRPRITLVSFSTRRSPLRNSPGRSGNRRCAISPVPLQTAIRREPLLLSAGCWAIRSLGSG